MEREGGREGEREGERLREQRRSAARNERHCCESECRSLRVLRSVGVSESSPEDSEDSETRGDLRVGGGGRAAAGRRGGVGRLLGGGVRRGSVGSGGQGGGGGVDRGLTGRLRSAGLFVWGRRAQGEGRRADWVGKEGWEV